MKNLKLLGAIFLPIVILAVLAAVPGPPTSTYTRTLLRATNAEEARAILEVTNVGGSVTNTIINAITINVSTTVVNVAKGGRFEVITNITYLTNSSVTFSNLPWPSVLLVGSDGNATNATLSGLTLVGNTLTATGGGSSWPTNFTTLTYTGGTNLLGFDGTTNGANYTVTLTNNAFIGGSNATNFPSADTMKSFVLRVIQDSVGLWTLTLDPTKFAAAEGSLPVLPTNGLGVSYYYFHTHATNGMLVVSMNGLVR